MIFNNQWKIRLGTRVGWKHRYAKIASDAGGACERSSRLVIEIDARFFFLQYQDFWKKVSQRDISWYPRALQYRVPGFLCHAVTLKKKERLRSNKSVTVTFFLQYRDSLPNGHGQNTGFEKNPGYRDFKKSWYWKKIWDIFWTIFGSIFSHFLPLLTKRVKNVHFWSILAYSCMQFPIFRTLKSRSVGR